MGLAPSGAGADSHRAGQPWLPIVADWLFFPHPVYAEGVLLVPPPQAPVSYCPGEAVNFPIKTGQEVTLQFATQAQVDVLKQSGRLPPRGRRVLSPE
jgi:hypothetical protein